MHTKRRGTRSQECTPGPMEHSHRRLQEQIPGVRRQQDMDGPSGCTNSSSQSHGINTRPSTGCDRQSQGSLIQIPGVSRSQECLGKSESALDAAPGIFQIDRQKMQSTARIEQPAQDEAAASQRHNKVSRSPASGVEWEQSNDDDYKSFLTSEQLQNGGMLKSWTGHRAVHAMNFLVQ